MLENHASSQNTPKHFGTDLLTSWKPERDMQTPPARMSFAHAAQSAFSCPAIDTDRDRDKDRDIDIFIDIDM